MSQASYEELIEIGNYIGIPAVESYKLDTLEGIHEMLKDMSSDEEGFVAFDGEHRVKIKNPKYVLRHRSETEFTQKDIFTILKENERDEFIGLLDRYEELYNEAEHFWLKLVLSGYKFRDNVLLFLKKSKTKKDFVFKLKDLKTDFNSFYFSTAYKMMDAKLSGNSYDLFNPESILREVDNKKLNEL